MEYSKDCGKKRKRLTLRPAQIYGTTFYYCPENELVYVKPTKAGGFEALKPYFFKTLGRWYVQYEDDDGKVHPIPRARIICQAYHPKKDPENWQAAHLDDDPSDDRPENICWMTRKENNSTEHSRRMRRLHGTSTDRRDQVIVARKGDEVQVFENGKAAAKALGRSHVAVYGAAGKPNRRCAGWHLSWAKRSEAPEPTAPAGQQTDSKTVE